MINFDARFGEILHRVAAGHDAGLGAWYVFIAIGGALFGGLLTEGLNRIIESGGGFLRKYATAKTYIAKLRWRYTTRVARRLRLIPMFQDLDDGELEEVAAGMQRQVYYPGDVIFNECTVGTPIYLLTHGEVELELHTKLQELFCDDRHTFVK